MTSRTISARMNRKKVAAGVCTGLSGSIVVKEGAWSLSEKGLSTGRFMKTKEMKKLDN